MTAIIMEPMAKLPKPEHRTRKQRPTSTRILPDGTLESYYRPSSPSPSSLSISSSSPSVRSMKGHEEDLDLSEQSKARQDSRSRRMLGLPKVQSVRNSNKNKTSLVLVPPSPTSTAPPTPESVKREPMETGVPTTPEEAAKLPCTKRRRQQKTPPNISTTTTTTAAAAAATEDHKKTSSLASSVAKSSTSTIPSIKVASKNKNTTKKQKKKKISSIYQMPPVLGRAFPDGTSPLWIHDPLPDVVLTKAEKRESKKFKKLDTGDVWVQRLVFIDDKNYTYFESVYTKKKVAHPPVGAQRVIHITETIKLEVAKPKPASKTDKKKRWKRSNNKKGTNNNTTSNPVSKFLFGTIPK